MRACGEGTVAAVAASKSKLSVTERHGRIMRQ